MKHLEEHSSLGDLVSEPLPERTVPHNKEFGLDKPTPFDGNQKKVESFIQECRVYLQINKRIYTTDEAKVAFFLSLMKEKEALRWKQTYLKSITNEEGDIIFPPVKEFVALLLNYFQPINQVADATHQMAILKQGKKTAEEVITEFRLLVAQAGFTSDSRSDHLHLIEKLQSVLNPSLVKKIMLMEKPPVTIDDWVHRAILIDGQYRATMDILGKRIDRKEKAGKPKWTNYFEGKKHRDERDPDAMDIDRMSIEKRTTLMKKGACFICEEPGHMAKDHYELEKKKKEKKTNVRRASTSSLKKKQDVKEIHALLQALSTEETKELLALQSSSQEKEERDDDDEDF